MSWDQQPNPYGSPYSQSSGQPHGQSNKQVAKQKLQAPAIGLMVVGIIGLLAMLIWLVFTIIGIQAQGGIVPPPNMPAEQKAGFYAGAYGVIGMMALNGICQTLIIYGAVCMLGARSRTVAVVACVAAMVPCLSSSCIIFGIPFGIWGVVVMNDPIVSDGMK